MVVALGELSAGAGASIPWQYEDGFDVLSFSKAPLMAAHSSHLYSRYHAQQEPPGPLIDVDSQLESSSFKPTLKLISCRTAAATHSINHA